jgi:hypothetical protein
MKLSKLQGELRGALNKPYSAGPAVLEGRRRYSPAEFVTSSKALINCNHDVEKASSSIEERSNLSKRVTGDHMVKGIVARQPSGRGGRLTPHA